MFDRDKSTPMEKQPLYNKAETWAKIKAKLQRVLDKGYVELVGIEYVELLMYMFHVPKDKKDMGWFTMGSSLD